MQCVVEGQQRNGGRSLAHEAAPMRAAGLDYDEILQLTRLRQRIEAGEVSELTMEYKRLLFIRCLVQSGRMHD